MKVKEKILITGFHGSLSKQLSKIIDYKNYEVFYLTTKKRICSNNIYYWNFKKNHIDSKALINTSHIIHLAGFNMSNNWSKKNKQLMIDSRVKTAELIYRQCQTLKVNLKTFISASAMGYYGFYQDGLKNEEHCPTEDWVSKLCVRWEKTANKFEIIGARVCKLRFALILDKKSKIIQKTCLGFKFGIGIILGNGKQKFPWIHIKDATQFIKHSLENQTIQGVFNVASTENISYYDFIKSMQTYKFPTSILIYIPKTIINLIMPKQKALIFNNINLCTKKMKKTKFKWKYKTICETIKQEF